MLFRHLAYVLWFPAALAVAADKRDGGEPKQVSGMSIVGNNESPKSLYIVPWKAPEVGRDISFKSSILNEELSPVDKSDFIREIESYKRKNQN